MAKRQRKSDDNNGTAPDPLDAMQYRHRQLQDTASTYNKEASSRVGSMVFTGLIAGGAFLADWTICGGVFTAFATLNAASAAVHGFKGYRANKVARKADNDLQEVLKKRALEVPAPAPQPREDLQTQFDAAANEDVESLRKRVRELEKQAERNDTQPRRVRIHNQDGPVL